MADAASGQGRISLLIASQGQNGTATDRPLTQAEFQREYLYDPPPLEGAGRQLLDRLRHQCPPSASCVVRLVARHVPILTWLPQYDVRSDLVGDIISGVTVAIMHIPQGMAYALLAGIPPIHGIYMGFFQCLLYACFGTSRQLSVGTFAVTCIMTGKVVAEHARPVQLIAADDDCGRQAAGCVASGGQPPYDAVQVATTLALAVGLVQLAMFVLRAGALTVILSDMLVRGFTTGAAVHVLCSQLQSLLGLSLPTHSGIGKLVKLVVAVIRNIKNVNSVSIVISITTTLILVFNNEVIKPRLAMRTRCPLPIELLLVIAGTALSFCTDLTGNHGVAVIGTITTGLPPPSRPVLPLLPDVLLDATIIAIITYSIAISMAQLLASKHKYTVDANQELLAQGIGNVVSAWFSSAPMGASLSRSLIADSTGSRTQAAGIITSLLLLIVLLWLGPVFQSLPKTILAAILPGLVFLAVSKPAWGSIIVVSLKGLLRQVKDVVPLWRTSRADALIWAATFAAAVAGDIDVGLAVGVATSLAVLMWRHQWPPAELLAPARAAGLYLNPEKYGTVESDHDIRIFRFGGALHFCNTRHFRRSLFELTGLDPEGCQPTETRRRTRHRQVHRTGKSHLRAELVPLTKECGDSDSDGAPPSPAESSTVQISFSHLVFDMSRVTFTDTASTRDLLKLLSQYRTVGVSCYLADCNETVLGLVEACSGGLAEDQLYPSLHDAVLAIRTSVDATSAPLTSESAS